MHSVILQEIDKRAADLDQILKPSKCASFLFDVPFSRYSSVQWNNQIDFRRREKISWEASGCVLVSNQKNYK